MMQQKQTSIRIEDIDPLELGFGIHREKIIQS